MSGEVGVSGMRKRKDTEETYRQLRGEVRRRVAMYGDTSDEEVSRIIDAVLKEASEASYLSVKERVQLQTRIFNAVRRLDLLQPLIDDKSVTEIMINGIDEIFVEKEGRLNRLDYTFESEEQLEHVIQKIVGQVNRVVNESSPICDARLSDGSRINVVLPPVALKGPTLTIRKFPEKRLSMDDLIAWGSITDDAADFLQKLVRAGYNIFVSGGTGSGKTTFLNILSDAIPGDERIITIEDSAELRIGQVTNLVSLETRNPNVEGRGGIDIRALIRSSLRMRPDRIIVGEVRGAEAIDMLQAMNTGHDGSLSTGHANSTEDMLSRLETMVLMGAQIPLMAIRKQIASAIDIMVHLGRRPDRSRKVLEIAEVVGCVDGEIVLNDLYRHEEDGDGKGELIRTQRGLEHRFKLRMKGEDNGACEGEGLRCL